MGIWTCKGTRLNYISIGVIVCLQLPNMALPDRSQSQSVHVTVEPLYVVLIRATRRNTRL